MIFVVNMNKEKLRGLSVAELQENLFRIELAVDEMMYCLENLEEERDELQAANQMFKETWIGLGGKVENEGDGKIRGAYNWSKGKIENQVKKIIDTHLTPKAMSFFKSNSTNPSPISTKKSAQNSSNSEIIPKARRFFASPGRFLINKLKRLT